MIEKFAKVDEVVLLPRQIYLLIKMLILRDLNN